MRLPHLFRAAALPALIALASGGLVQAAPAQPFKVIQTAQVGGPGGWDYVYADSAGRRLYVSRGDHLSVYNLDTLQPAGTIGDLHNVHEAAVDPKSGHGFTSSNPVVMFDAKTLAPLKTIPVTGSPDGILFDPATEHVLVLSHRAPNVTVLDVKDGTLVGTLGLNGAPEQAASDGQGHIYVALENRDKVAVIDAKALKVTTDYDLAGHGGGPAGLALDVANHVLFVCCHNPHTAVFLNAETGKILATLPIGDGVDSAGFDPQTGELFSSQRDGTLTVIKENSPTDFVVEQTVQTMAGARTSAVDPQTGHVFLVAAKMAAPATAPAAAATTQRRWGRFQMVPDSFTILVVGR